MPYHLLIVFTVNSPVLVVCFSIHVYLNATYMYRPVGSGEIFSYFVDILYYIAVFIRTCHNNKLPTYLLAKITITRPYKKVRNVIILSKFTFFGLST